MGEITKLQPAGEGAATGAETWKTGGIGTLACVNEAKRLNEG